MGATQRWCIVALVALAVPGVTACPKSTLSQGGACTCPTGAACAALAAVGRPESGLCGSPPCAAPPLTTLFMGDDWKAFTMKANLFNATGELSSLKIYIRTYTLDGTLASFEPLTDQISFCDLSSLAIQKAVQLGNTILAKCRLDWKSLVEFPTTLFYELLLEDTSGLLRPIPALIRFDNGDVHQDDYTGKVINEVRSTQSRFMLYDNTGRGGSGSSYYVTHARQVALMFRQVAPYGPNIHLPYIVLQYISHEVSRVGREEVSLVRKLKEEVKYKYSYYRVQSIGQSGDYWRGTLIAMSCCLFISFFTSTFKAFVYIRRRTVFYLDFGWLAALAIAFTDHAAFLCGVSIYIISAYWWIAYKLQMTVFTFLGDGVGAVGWALLGTALLKVLNVALRLWKQTCSNVFFVDWEKPKGKVLPGDTTAPPGARADVAGTDSSISMWRSVLVANEYNKLQNYEDMRLAFIIMAYLAIWEGIGMGELTYTQTSSKGVSARGDELVSHPLLRVFMSGLLFAGLRLLVWVYHTMVLYRFFRVHPVRQFVDLCSVSNVSTFIMVEDYWGYYVHGKTTSPYADVTMREMIENLNMESKGVLGERGLQSTSLQTYEIFVDEVFRQHYTVKYQAIVWNDRLNAMKRVRQPGKRGVEEPDSDTLPINTAPQPALHLLVNGRRRYTASDQLVKSHEDLSEFLRATIERVGPNVLPKFWLHDVLDFPPPVGWYIAKLHGDNEKSKNGHASGTAVLFSDPLCGFRRHLLVGTQSAIFSVCLLTFWCFDVLFTNSYISLTVMYGMYLAIIHIRKKFGEVSLTSKSLLDDRFYLSSY